MEKKKNLSVKSFLGSLAVIFALMVVAYVLTFIIPAGEYARTTDANGNSIIDTSIGYTQVEGGLPFWKWILSPFLVLGAEGNSLLLAIIAFLLVIGGIFSDLNDCSLMQYMLGRIVHKFRKNKYGMLCVVTLFFMLMGSFVGSFEEVVPMVPILVGVSVGLGWDVFTGIGMSLLAAGCGFAAGVMNPFTVGIAQKLAGLPMFSGVGFRILSFVLINLLLVSFLVFHAKKVEKKTEEREDTFTVDKKMDRALALFGILLGAGIVLVLLSPVIPALQDYTMIIVAVMFLVAGTVSSFAAGMKPGAFFKSFGKGILGILPAVLMILMASSIKYIFTESKILDTILYGAVGLAEHMPKIAVILFIYLIVLVMNFFIASGSAKAFLLIPLIVPMAQIFGISSQLCIVAFAFGDGFSNCIYPTNAALLIALGLADVGYGKYFKWAWKFQAANLVLTSLILLLGLAIGY